MKIDVPYGITRQLDGVDLAAAKERVTAALKVEGFGILTEIDVQQTLEKKLGVQVDPYVILGACNPALAHAAASPKALFTGIGAGGALAAFADDAEARVCRAIESA
jgi:hypothetical protein